MTGAQQTKGRKAADKAMSGRQKMWEALKADKDCITVSGVVQRSGVHRTTVLRYLKALAQSGHLSTTDSDPGQPNIWKLEKNVGHHAPRVRKDGSQVTQGITSQQLWTAMCGLKTFDAADLIQSASIVIPIATAKDYCKRLLSAGYLKVTAKAIPAAGKLARYQLLRNSGPQAPQVQRVQQVFDPNTGTAYKMEGRP